jgi:hypothetical protein
MVCSSFANLRRGRTHCARNGDRHCRALLFAMLVAGSIAPNARAAMTRAAGPIWTARELQPSPIMSAVALSEEDVATVRDAFATVLSSTYLLRTAPRRDSFSLEYLDKHLTRIEHSLTRIGEALAVAPAASQSASGNRKDVGQGN